MPDLERRSSASFISSKEGGTPDSFSRSLMNRRSSYCLRVSISTSPQVATAASQSAGFETHGSTQLPNIIAELRKTNHERTLSVPYVFRNHLIFRLRSVRTPNPQPA